MPTTPLIPPAPEAGMPPAFPPPAPLGPMPAFGLLPGEAVAHLNAGNQTYTVTTSPTYIYGNTGNDTINGGASNLSTVDYSALKTGVTLGIGGTVSKGLNGASGIDQLINIHTIVGAAGQNNTIDAQTGSIPGVSISVNLQTHDLQIKNIPGLGNLDFQVVNFNKVIGPNAADTFVGNNANDTFVGGAGSTFTTGTGHNTLTGGGSKDTFNFGGGNDVITNFNIAGGDIINSHTQVHDITAVQGGTLVHFAPGQSIMLVGVNAADLIASHAIHLI